MLAGRIVPVASDPLGLARGLAARGHSGIALLHVADPRRPGWPAASFLAADPDDVSDAFDPFSAAERSESSPPAAVRTVSDATSLVVAGPALSRTDAADRLVSQAHLLARAPRWIGVLPYEARRDLERPAWRPAETRPPALLDRPLWLRYPAVACFDHASATVLVVGVTEAAASAFAASLRAVKIPSIEADLRISVEDDEPPARHAERIAAARELILAGDLYQVNLARRLRIALHQGAPLALHARLARAAHAPFGAYLDLGDATVLCTSPELLLEAEASADGASFDRLATEPIKGTRPRGAHAAADEALARELADDPKERAELAMIVDVERNDLGRVAATGSVRVASPPHVVTHRTVHHRVARVIARARAGVSREEVLRAMVPSGSVTGAPKVRAMEVIASLEAKRRGLYTGGLGFVRHDGGVVLAMAIRTVVLRGAAGEYWTGGGIVADSDPQREVEETRWKALQLTRAATRPAM